MNLTLMDGRTDRGGKDVKQECPGNKAGQLGLSREYEAQTICSNGWSLTAGQSLDMEVGGKPLATFDYVRDVLGRVTCCLC